MDRRYLKDMAHFLLQGGAKPEKAFMYLKSVNGAMDEANLWELISECMQHKKRNLSEVTDLYVGVTTEWFTTQDLYRDCNILPDERHACVLKLRSLVVDGTLEADKKVNGKYRLRNHKLNIMDWKSANVSDTWDILFPFAMHNYWTLYPQNIVIFSGEKNTGKTAIANAIIKHNMNKFKIRTLTSEGSEEEIKARRLAHVELQPEDWKDEVVVCSRYYHDAILADHINIIDYLELPAAEFYSVLGIIRDIYEALGKGIAIIFLQKHTKSNYGVGGAFTVEKARVVCNLVQGNPKECLVQMVKNPKKGLRNPNGLRIFYQVTDEGAKLVPVRRQWPQMDVLSTPEEVDQINKEGKVEPQGSG